jgi:hypothetical protein
MLTTGSSTARLSCRRETPGDVWRLDTTSRPNFSNQLDGFLEHQKEKFVVPDEGARQIHPTYGYYSPVRSPIVESGVYRIGGDRLIWPRPKPILRREISPVPPISGILPTMISQPTDYPVAMPSHSTVTSPQFGLQTISSQPSSPHLVPGSPQEAIRSSSPGPGFLLSPSLANFSDMSSVRHPSSAERSFYYILVSPFFLPKATDTRLTSSSEQAQPFFPNYCCSFLLRIAK